MTDSFLFIMMFHLFRKQKKNEDTSSIYDLTRFKGHKLANDSVDDASNIQYQPQTAETKQVYGRLLHFIQGIIGDQVRAFTKKNF